MLEATIREPEEIREGCARKLKPASTSGKVMAVVGHLLGEAWTKPVIAELRVSPAGNLIARADGAVVFKYRLGTRGELIRELHALARAANLDGDEIGYLLGRVAMIKRL